MVEAVGPLLNVFEEVVAEHERNPAEDESPRDFIDMYMSEIKKTSNPESSFYGKAGRKHAAYRYIKGMSQINP